MGANEDRIPGEFPRIRVIGRPATIVCRLSESLREVAPLATQQLVAFWKVSLDSDKLRDMLFS